MKIALIQQFASNDIESNIQLGLDNLDQAASRGAKLFFDIKLTHGF